MPRAAATRAAATAAGEVRAADARTLPSRTRSSSAPQRLLDRRRGIGPVQLIEVDPVGAQPLRLASTARHDVAARRALHLARAVHRHAEFGGEHDVLAPRAQGFAKVCLRPAAIAVDVGGVEQRDAGVERAMHHRARGGEVDAPAEVVAAEPDDARRRVRAAELALSRVPGEGGAALTLPPRSGGEGRAPPKAVGVGGSGISDRGQSWRMPALRF